MSRILSTNLWASAQILCDWICTGCDNLARHFRKLTDHVMSCHVKSCPQQNKPYIAPRTTFHINDELIQLRGMSNFSSEINRYRIKFVTSRIAQIIASSAHPLGILKLLSSVINKGTCIHGALKILFHFLLDTNHTYNNDPSY